jgi:hypothetical protein
MPWEDVIALDKGEKVSHAMKTKETLKSTLGVNTSERGDNETGTGREREENK